jgi:hypothetical protein
MMVWGQSYFQYRHIFLDNMNMIRPHKRKSYPIDLFQVYCHFSNLNILPQPKTLPLQEVLKIVTSLTHFMTNNKFKRYL